MEENYASLTPGKPPEEKKESVKLPVLDSPNFFLDEPTGMLWVGIPLKSCDLLRSWCILDQGKTICFSYHEKMKKQMSLANGVKRTYNQIRNAWKMGG